ncbi:MAG: thermonuclease family protein [Proteobacteria bacterium]|nr:thermonuclease family protein [Pseudomonadota bacterium]
MPGPRAPVARRLALVVAGLALFALLGALAGAGRGAEGAAGAPVRVIDADTLQIEGRTVELSGIDAPELGQLCFHDGRPWPCGVDAALALRKLLAVSRAAVSCDPAGAGRAGRAAVCEVNHQEIAIRLLRQGYALAAPGAAPEYAEAEREARRAGLGLWRGPFTPPWAWRAGERMAEEQGPEGVRCPVKGVRDAAGRRVYLVPTDAEYERAGAGAAAQAGAPAGGQAGARLFCSDEEARKAGYGRPEG